MDFMRSNVQLRQNALEREDVQAARASVPEDVEAYQRYLHD
jgi:hypothetical protein